MKVFFIPAYGETSLYLTNYIEDFVQVLHKHFRGGGGSRPMLIMLVEGGGWGSGIMENMLM